MNARRLSILGGLVAMTLLGCDDPPETTSGTSTPSTVTPSTKPSAALGPEDVYRRYCVVCHQEDGTGKNGLTGANFVGPESPLAKSDDQLFLSVKEGLTGGPVVMPPHKDLLTDEQIRSTIAYVRERFGSKAETE